MADLPRPVAALLARAAAADEILADAACDDGLAATPLTPAPPPGEGNVVAYNVTGRTR